ncbi:MAG: hypothetical protein GY743_23605 [Planctomycetaceae bacterium]|nr:hypothetical protein [Planctomycetaceae bacterium]
MDREEVDQEYLFELLERGWFVVWFAFCADEEELLADLCCNYRLEDGKVMFVQCPIEDKQVIADLATKAMGQWTAEFEKMKTAAIAEF